MKFFYILNKGNKLIDFGKILSERGVILTSLTGLNLNLNQTDKNFLPIKFDIKTLKNLIDILLKERNSNPLDIPDYKGRFLENEIFEFKNYNNSVLKLCNTGFDNKLIFLINIYDSLLKNEHPYYILFTNNQREFTEWQETKF